MFSDDVICSKNRKQVEENLERLGYELKRRGMKVNHSGKWISEVTGNSGGKVP